MRRFYKLLLLHVNTNDTILELMWLRNFLGLGAHDLRDEILGIQGLSMAHASGINHIAFLVRPLMLPHILCIRLTRTTWLQVCLRVHGGSSTARATLHNAKLRYNNEFFPGH